ncbi:MULTISPECIES: flagellar protein FlaG [Pseudoalteromonas]|jgi:flagellar protein FlaG|uniref:flagellar protein FlaG n=1 Tax=Pseudoalteromonas TaxID=53246 RepID=UPI0002CBE460|nr:MULTISPECIES: flagellar protein FlaG [Pseudoalteromonas]MCP4059081.1 flagellar protein FlaG [Pseudoalteromonas sp.]ENN98158.1 flagellin protein [Pseudoalteromonas agarivorans S816]MDI3245161.1 flagellar protein FlaG [Pseudoalteromonas agarivorans]TMS67226.1 flagellin [Pseudoalteromonas sp. S1691]TMS71537.1 flagellin [Pseudoalteromonas sp. S1731]
MNTITSNAEVTIASTSLTDEDKQIGQSGATLTQRAVDDVNKTDEQGSQNQLNNHYTQQRTNDNSSQNQQLEREQLEKVAQQLQEFMGEMSRSLQFQVDEDSGRDVIKILDKTSGDVIKQYPSEEVLSLVSKLSESAGILIDQTV